MIKIDNRWLFFLGFMCFLINGCAQQVISRDFSLNSSTQMTLPPPKLESPLELQSKIVIVPPQGRSITAFLQLNATQDTLDLTLLTEVGVELAHLHYDGEIIQLNKKFSLVQLPEISEVLAMVMLAYYPITLWEGYLPDSWQVLDREAFRFLQDDQNETVITVYYMGEGKNRLPTRLTHHNLKYLIRLEVMNNTDKEGESDLDNLDATMTGSLESEKPDIINTNKLKKHQSSNLSKADALKKQKNIVDMPKNSVKANNSSSEINSDDEKPAPIRLEKKEEEGESDKKEDGQLSTMQDE